MVAGDALQLGVGVHGDRVAHSLQHREVAGGVAVGPAALEVEVLFGGELLDGLHLARPVAERPVEIAGVDAIHDAALRADAGGHPQRLGERFHEFDGRRRHDVGGSSGLAMLFDEPHGLGAHALHELRHDVGVQRHEIVDSHPADGAENAVAYTV